MKNQMRDFIKEVMEDVFAEESDSYYNQSPLLKYINLKTGAIYGNSKTRRSLANIYAIYSILYFYQSDFYDDPKSYKAFTGYEYTKLFSFYRGLYGGKKLENHALNSRVNGEFKNKIVTMDDPDLISSNEGKYLLNISYLYVNDVDISKIAVRIIERYITLLQAKDTKLTKIIQKLAQTESTEEKKQKITGLLDETTEARIFEIVSYSILKNHYSGIGIFIGYSKEDIEQQYLTLYKTGRTNANDGGIDFVMKPIGRFFQVTEVNNYDKYLLDMDKVMHFPITFVIKTEKSKEIIKSDLKRYIEAKSGGMEVIRKRYNNAIEEIITINELKIWLNQLTESSVDQLLHDLNLYYRLELNLPLIGSS